VTSSPDRTLTIGLDVGGTKIAGGLVSPEGAIIDLVIVDTRVEGRPDPGLRRTRRVAEELLRRAGTAGYDLDGIGAGFAEYVSPDGRLTSRLVLDWETQPAALLADLGAVTVESDVRCGAIAEAVHGAGAGAGHAGMLYLSVGTGISSTYVQGTLPLRGHRGEAIAFGELPVAPDVEPTAALTLEQFASGDGISSRFKTLTGEPAEGARPCLVAAEQGQPGAQAIVGSAARAVAAALAWAVGLFDPAVVVVGGGIGTSGGQWERELRCEFARRNLMRPQPPPLLIATLGPHAGVVGAAEAHRRRLPPDTP